MSQHIIAYDIRDRSRLQKIHRILLSHAFPIAYSVFMYEGCEHGLRVCLNEITQVIDKKQDDVRSYPLPQRGLKIRLGKAVLPAGITCTSLPTAFMVL